MKNIRLSLIFTLLFGLLAPAVAFAQRQKPTATDSDRLVSTSDAVTVRAVERPIVAKIYVKEKRNSEWVLRQTYELVPASTADVPNPNVQSQSSVELCYPKSYQIKVELPADCTAQCADVKFNQFCPDKKGPAKTKAKAKSN